MAVSYNGRVAKSCTREMAVSYTGRRGELHQNMVLPSREKTTVIYTRGTAVSYTISRR